MKKEKYKAPVIISISIVGNNLIYRIMNKAK